MLWTAVNTGSVYYTPPPFLYAAAKLYPDGVARNALQDATGCSHHLNAEKHRYKRNSHYFELKGIKYPTDCYFRLDLVWVRKIITVFLNKSLHLKFILTSTDRTQVQEETGRGRGRCENSSDTQTHITWRPRGTGRGGGRCESSSLYRDKQECIPVGCVPSATVAICWGEGGICHGLLLWSSVMAFWFGGLLIEGGLLVESGLLLWPSGVAAFCYGLLVERGWTNPQKTIPEGHLQSEGHTRRP